MAAPNHIVLSRRTDNEVTGSTPLGKNDWEDSTNTAIAVSPIINMDTAIATITRNTTAGQIFSLLLVIPASSRQ
jgi:hypothetical protein